MEKGDLRLRELDYRGTGENLRVLRKNHGLTMFDLSLELGVNPKTIARWEHGEIAPQLSHVVMISEYFNVDYDEWIETRERNE